MVPRFLILCGLVAYVSAVVKLQELYSWNAMDWNYPDELARHEALQTGGLIPENALPVGIERWKNKLFVSVPRWRPGIPATLNYIPLDAPYNPSPKLNPYPSWEGNELGNCRTGLNTVYRIKADQCDRLWVLDTGTYGYDPNVTNVCPYTLNVYDLNTDKIIRKYVFRPEDIVPTTFIANIALDMGRNCDDTFAYFSDELGYGIIAYSWEQNRSWRFSHSFFMPDPLRGNYNIAGLNFQWGAEGIFGITASPINDDGFRTVYFSPISSYNQFAVSTRTLRNESRVNEAYYDFVLIGDRGSYGHGLTKVMDESGVELFSLIDQNAIGCWNSYLPYKPQNIAVVDKDDVALIFPCDVKIDEGRNVWVISERMPVFLEAELDYSDINFRIFTAPLDVLLDGTVCEPSVPIPASLPVRIPKVNPQNIDIYNIGPGLNPNGLVAPYFPNSSPQPQSYPISTSQPPEAQPQIIQFNPRITQNVFQSSTPQPPISTFYPQVSQNIIPSSQIRPQVNQQNLKILNPQNQNKIPLSSSRPLLFPVNQQVSNLQYPQQWNQNVSPKVQNYVNIPKQPSKLYYQRGIVGQGPARPQSYADSWWLTDNDNYQVIESA